MRKIQTMKAEPVVPPSLCPCGCGQPVKWNKVRKRWNKYIHGHNPRTVHKPNCQCAACLVIRGEKNFGFKKGQIAWNKGLTKYTHPGIRRVSEKLTGIKRDYSWNRGETKETDERIRGLGIKIGKRMKEKYANGYVCPNKGKSSWAKGLNKKEDKRIKERTDKIDKYWETHSRYGKGMTYEEIFGKPKADRIKKQQSLSGIDMDFYEQYGHTRSSHPYNDIFDDECKEIVRKIYNYTCPVSGITNKEHKQKYGRQLTIHHWNYDKDADDLFYFIPVSKDVHGSAHGKKSRGDWIDMFNGIAEDRWCELFKEKA